MNCCSNDGCKRPVIGQGQCIEHYKSPTGATTWIVINTVYFNDGSHEIYGYKVKNEDGTKRKIISSKTANALTLKGELRVSDRQELSFCSVGRDFIEVD